MPRAFLLLLGLLAGGPLLSQGGTIVRGVVRGEGDLPLPWATVELSPALRIFTDDSGKFVFPSVNPGRYDVRVRRLGHVPRDTAITVGGEPLSLALHLDRLAIALAEVRVVAQKGCVHPGPPDPVSEPTLAAIFEQLHENADRWLLLAARHPFEETVERRVTLRRADGSFAPGETDTLVVGTGTRWRYVPGGVITMTPTIDGMKQQMNIPGLPEFADTTFHRAHCFSYAGIQRVKGHDYVRVDFRPADTLSTPDVDGSVYLDTDGYQLRRAELRLTHPEAAGGSLQGLRATTVFREIVPSIVVLETVDAMVTWDETGPKSTVQRTERQRMARMLWHGAPPPGVTKP